MEVIESAVDTYSFGKIASEVKLYERNRGIPLARVSDWNSSPKDVSVPFPMYMEAFEKSLATITKYPDVDQTKNICEQIRLTLLSKAITTEKLHIFGSATQAINMLFFALSVKNPGARVIILNPSYFSIKNSAETFGLMTETIYRSSSNGFQFPTAEIEAVRLKYGADIKQKVCAIAITEPIYSSGVKQHSASLQAFAKYCGDNDLLLIIDGAFSGLSWEGDYTWQDLDLLSLLKHKHVALVDSISKSLFILNTKVGILYGPQWLVEIAESGISWISGNITALQQQLVASVFSRSCEPDITRSCRQNIEHFKNRFAHLERLAVDSPYRLLRPDSGYHTMAVRADCTIGSVDVMGWSRHLIEKGVYALPGHAFGYSNEDRFCFRISLARRHDDLKIRSVFDQPVI
jgi:aspartate/methionine/tyrosine aminotransferase